MGHLDVSGAWAWEDQGSFLFVVPLEQGFEGRLEEDMKEIIPDVSGRSALAFFDANWLNMHLLM